MHEQQLETTGPDTVDGITKTEPIMQIDNLGKTFSNGSTLLGTKRTVRAVDGISLNVHEGETLAVVGESGSGKSTLARLLLKLIRPTSGTVYFGGVDIGGYSKNEVRKFRKMIQLVFQDPYSSLNPRMTVGAIIEEPMTLHGIGNRSERRQRTGELLRRVGLHAEFINRFPHEFSGGQRQRIGIARALASNPKVLIGDEPVSALDVSVQAQVINLIEELKVEFNLTLVLIAHDLAVIRHMSDRIAVMYLGQIVELAGNDELFSSPLHPYTRGLIGSIPIPTPGKKLAVSVVEGDIPSPLSPPDGCRFNTRCPFSTSICKSTKPELEVLEGGRSIACHHWKETTPFNNQFGKLNRTANAERRFAIFRDLSETMVNTGKFPLKSQPTKQRRN